jgi:hypothetical protein
MSEMLGSLAVVVGCAVFEVAFVGSSLLWHADKTIKPSNREMSKRNFFISSPDVSGKDISAWSLF